MSVPYKYPVDLRPKKAAISGQAQVFLKSSYRFWLKNIRLYGGYNHYSYVVDLDVPSLDMTLILIYGKYERCTKRRNITYFYTSDLNNILVHVWCQAKFDCALFCRGAKKHAFYPLHLTVAFQMHHPVCVWSRPKTSPIIFFGGFWRW